MGLYSLTVRLHVRVYADVVSTCFHSLFLPLRVFITLGLFLHSISGRTHPSLLAASRSLAATRSAGLLLHCVDNALWLHHINERAETTIHTTTHVAMALTEASSEDQTGVTPTIRHHHYQRALHPTVQMLTYGTIMEVDSIPSFHHPLLPHQRGTWVPRLLF